MGSSNESLKLGHKRSVEARKRRNKTKKEKKKLKKNYNFTNKIESNIKNECLIIELKRENGILRRHLQTTKTCRLKPNTSMFHSTISSMFRDKCDSVILNLNRKTPSLLATDIHFLKDIGQGVFGKVKHCFINSIQQNVAVKTFHAKVSKRKILAEALVGFQMSGNARFPYHFGMIDDNEIVMEYIANSATLHTLLKDGKLDFWHSICVDIVRAMTDLHAKNIIHNDLHANNVIVRNEKFVKIIDFGKCMMASDPVTYNIKKDSEKQKIYNQRHCHLAYELRNVPGSKVTFASDVYSVGYLYNKIADNVHSEKLRVLSSHLLHKNPLNRPHLSAVLSELLLFSTKRFCS